MLLAICLISTVSGQPRRVQMPSRLEVPPFVPKINVGTLDIRPVEITLDGWAFYAKSGGMVVAYGQATQPFIYDCDTHWDGQGPLCKVGRSAVKMPNHALTIVGMGFTTIQDAVRRARSTVERPRYKVRDVYRDGQLNVKALVAVLPLVNLGVLEHGGYANVLVSLP